jgi:hypothetical protein
MALAREELRHWRVVQALRLYGHLQKALRNLEPRIDNEERRVLLEDLQTAVRDYRMEILRRVPGFRRVRDSEVSVGLPDVVFLRIRRDPVVAERSILFAAEMGNLVATTLLLRDTKDDCRSVDAMRLADALQSPVLQLTTRLRALSRQPSRRDLRDELDVCKRGLLSGRYATIVGMQMRIARWMVVCESVTHARHTGLREPPMWL